MELFIVMRIIGIDTYYFIMGMLLRLDCYNAISHPRLKHIVVLLP